MASLGTAGLIATGPDGLAATRKEVAVNEAAVESVSPAAYTKFLERYPTSPLSERILQIVHDRTSVKMIEDHYGHVTPVKNAERILKVMPGWEPIEASPQEVR